MINTQLKFEGKIPTVQAVEFTRNHTKFIFKFQDQFYKQFKFEDKILNG